MEQENLQSMAIDLPDLAVPEPESYIKAEPEVEEDKKQVAIQFGFIGIGQAGCKMANEFYRLGYRRVIAINTAKNDFAGLDIPVKRHLILGDGSGAGKDPAKGANAVEAQREDILSLIRRTFGDKVDKLIVLASAGGGTGNGGTLPMIQLAQDYMKELGKEASRNVGAVVALPKDSEKGITQINSAKLTEALFAKAEVDLAPLIIVDNEQIAKQWPNASIGQVFDMANKNICGLFDIFNTLACRQSQFSAFDKADLCSVLDKGAVCFGATKLKEVASASAISDAIRTNLQRGLLVEGINLASSDAGAGVLVGPLEILNTLPSSFVDEAFKTLARVLGSDSKPITVHQGVFETTKPDLFLYTIAGGFDMPEKRIEKMKRG
jgi:cell division GTPase FtsZ